ncbi:carboxymuconolactone decarboxylase family protein [Pseudomonas aeruginosa]|uniref:carboxymuconolactone decarboxylase family protein n=1 Tax=Pseudomonas aeruginosa TaxID=287 RepID=UPI00163BEA52|nr:carboxymuconolactone decarboxylase family protein [Pseudomonas aeruginosa]
MSGATDSNQADFDRGLTILRLIGGENFDGPINNLAKVSKDMAHFTVAFPYGQVLSRDQLDLRTRQICTISSLIAHGSAQSQLTFHMHGLLNAGGTPQDLIEVMFLSTAVLGFPAAINAINILRAIFAERSITYRVAPAEETLAGASRYEKGLVAFEELMKMPAPEHMVTLQPLSPDMARWSMEFAFGEVLGRDGLSADLKHLAIISMLATCGNRQDTMALHMRAARRSGISAEQLAEVLIQLSVYAGFPSALNAFSVLSKPLTEPSALSTPIPAPRLVVEEQVPSRMERGVAALVASSGASGEAVVRSFDDIAPDIGRLIVEHSYGEYLLPFRP